MYAKVTQLNFALIIFGLLLSATGARGQAVPPQFYVVCVSQENLPTVYMSGILQGPATAIQGFVTGFNQFLAQTYSYKGNVGCNPTRTAANAATFVQTQTNTLRNLKKNLVQTGWTQGAAATSGAAAVTNVVGSLLGGGASNTAAAVKGGGQTATASQTQGAGQPNGTSVSQGGNSSAGAPVINIFNNLFGGGSSAGSGGAATPPVSSASGAPASQAAANKASAGTGSGASASANPTTQVASVLSGLFSKGSSNSSAPNSTGNAGTQPKPVANGAGGRGAQPQQTPAAAQAGSSLPAGALGMAQFANSKLTVYGCGRQGTQVLCVTDLTNQNAQDTLVQSAAIWKDAFLVDDRGDRHTRTDGYFLNIDGDKRPQLDISNGQSAHFILAFDAVQSKVEKVTLRSTTGGLDVENIALIVPGASGEAQPTASQAQAGPAAH